MASWNIAVVGANGQVGSSLVELLANSSLEIDQLYLLGSDNSEGQAVRFSGKNLSIKHIDSMDWANCHLAFFVANQSVSQQYAKVAAQSGCIVLDATGVFALDDNIPLIIPQINDAMLADYRNENIISLANPIVSQALRCLAAFTDIEQLAQIHITNMLPASFYGKQGVNELAGQSARLLNGLSAENDFFPKQIAFNVLPNTLIDDAIVVDQIKRITANYQLSITIDSILVPVFYGLSQSISFTSATAQGTEQNQSSFDKYGISTLNNDYPTPVSVINIDQPESQGIIVANFHQSYGNEQQIQFTSVSDNVRYLGAKILLETAQNLLTNYI